MEHISIQELLNICDYVIEHEKEMGTLKVGDYFWEYDNGVGYLRKAHSENHIRYFWKGYRTRAFFTKEELLSVYPDAFVS